MAELRCPPRDQLSAFVLGKLTEARLEEVARHLDQCASCEAEIAALEQESDDVLTGLRRAGTAESGRPLRFEEEAPALLGDYQVIREVGRGGMGIVYEAEQVSLGRRVALKVLPRQFLHGPNAVDRFRREARAAARLHHTNIVQIFGTGEQDGLHYFVMQLIRGAGLDSVVKALKRRREKLPGTAELADANRSTADQESLSAIVRRLIGQSRNADALSLTPEPGLLLDGHASEHPRAYWQRVAGIGLQIAEALAFAHARGVLHRDVKPSNLLIDASGQAWLADFGLAKEAADAENLTASGFMIGTLRYVPPERFQGQSDARGDVYGLGISLYELLTLGPAFGEPDRSRLLHQILQDDPPRPSKVNVAVPRDLETIVLKAVARDPRHRYQTAAAMAEDLRLFLADKPIRARRASQVEKAWRWCRRKPVLAGLTSALVLTFLLGSAGVSWKWWEAEQQRRVAEEEKAKVVEAQRQALAERDAAASARDESHRVLAGVMLDQGITQAEQGEVAEGLFRMLEGLRVAPPHDADLARVIRSNLAGWLDQSYALRQMIVQPEKIWQCAFSPDGKRLAIRAEDGVRLRDAATGRLLDLHFEDDGPIAFSPDGTIFLTTSRPKRGQESQVQPRDPITGKPIGHPLAHSHLVHAVVFSPDGKQIATGDDEGTVRLWNATSRRLQSDVIRCEATAVNCLDWSPDGKTLVVGTAPPRGREGGLAYLWDPATGKLRGTPMEHKGGVTRARFSPDGKRVLTASSDGLARLWDASTGRPVGSPMGHPVREISAQFSPDGRALVVGSGDGVARWWDARTAEPLVGSLPRHRGALLDLAFSPDGTMLAAAGGYDGLGTLCLWQVPMSLCRPARRDSGNFIKAHWALNDTLPWFGRQFVVYSPDKTLVLTGSNDAMGRLYETSSGKPVAPPLRNTWDGVILVAFSPDGRLAATASQDRTAIGDVRLWNVATRRAVGPPLPHLNWVAAMAFSPDSRTLASGGYDGALSFWDTTTGKRNGAALPQDGVVAGIAFNPAGTTLAVAVVAGNGQARGLTLWDLRSHRPIRHLDLGPWPIFEFSLDGRLLATASGTKLQLWDGNSGSEVRAPMLETTEVNALAFSPDGKRIVTGSTDGTARLWDTSTGQPVGAPLLHNQRVNVVAFSPDAAGRWMAIGYGDGSARLWDRATQKRLGPSVRLNRTIWGAAITPDHRQMLTTTDDGTTRAWPIAKPIKGDLNRLALQLQVRTGMEMDPGQAVLQLAPSEWERRRQSLASQAGSIRSAWATTVSPIAFHDAHAQDAELDHDAFGERWHLDRLIVTQQRHASSQPADAWFAYARRARSVAVEGLWERAAADDRETQRLAGADSLLLWYRHCIVNGLDDKEWAATRWYLDRAEKLAPDDWQLRADRARLEFRQGHLAQSAAALNQAISQGADPRVLLHLGDEYTRESQWRPASLAYAHAVPSDPGPFISWERQAVVLLKTNDVASYRKLCDHLVQANSISVHRSVFNAAAWACALAQGGLRDYSPLSARMEEIVRASHPAAEHRDLLNTLGAILYRSGRDREAVQRLTEAINETGGKGLFEDWVFLALAHHRLGHAEQARKFAAMVEAASPSPGEAWQRLEFEMLRQEVQSTVAGSASAPAP